MSMVLKHMKQAVENSGKSRYLIAKESGINQSQLSRLVNGKTGMTIANFEKLAEYLGLELIIRPKSKRKGV